MKKVQTTNFFNDVIRVLSFVRKKEITISPKWKGFFNKIVREMKR
jgi:hypothetical protein